MSLADDAADYARERGMRGMQQGHWVESHYAVVDGVRKFIPGHWSLNPIRGASLDSDSWQRNEAELMLRRRLENAR